MALIIPDGYGQVTHHFALTGSAKSMSWSHGYQWTGAGDAPAHAEAIQEAATATTGPYHADHMVLDWTYEGTSTIENQDGVMALGVSPVAIAGSNMGAAAAPNISILLKKVTGIGGRKNQGRAFVPPCFPGENVISTTGTIDSGTLDSMVGFYSSYMNDLTDADIVSVIFHTDSTTPTLFHGLLPQTMVATQRRRLR